MAAFSIVTALAGAVMEVAESGRTMPAIGWASATQTGPSMAATARHRLPASDPHTRMRVRGTIPRHGPVRAKPAVGIISARRGRPAARLGAAMAPPERMLEAADTARARRTAATADTARAHPTAAAAHPRGAHPTAAATA